MTDNKQIEIYQTEDGQTQIQVRLEQDTLWLSQVQMAELFDKDSDTIGLHLKNIYKSGELDKSATTEDSSVVRLEGKRKVRRKIKIYNLDAAKVLKKAAKVMESQKKQTEWLSYLNQLKKTHKRKPRLMEVIDRFEKNSIIGDHFKPPKPADLFK